jgi:hypothetical protein
MLTLWFIPLIVTGADVTSVDTAALVTGANVIAFGVVSAELELLVPPPPLDPPPPQLVIAAMKKVAKNKGDKHFSVACIIMTTMTPCVRVNVEENKKSCGLCQSSMKMGVTHLQHE